MGLTKSSSKNLILHVNWFVIVVSSSSQELHPSQPMWLLTEILFCYSKSGQSSFSRRWILFAGRLPTQMTWRGSSNSQGKQNMFFNFAIKIIWDKFSWCMQKNKYKFTKVTLASLNTVLASNLSMILFFWKIWKKLLLTMWKKICNSSDKK